MTRIGMLVALLFVACGLLLGNLRRVEALQSDATLYVMDMKSDGRLATGNRNGDVKVYSATGEMLHTFHAGDFVTAVAWNPRPDDNRLVATSTDGTITVWDASSGTLLTSFHDTASVNRAIWNPFGTEVATADVIGTGPSANRYVVIWNPISGERLKVVGDGSYISLVAWDPASTSNSNRIATGTTDGFIDIWDAGSPEDRISTSIETIQMPFQHPSSLEWNLDGSMLAITGSLGGLEILDGRTYTVKATYDIGATRNVAWGADNRLLAVAELKRVLVMDVTTGQTLSSAGSDDLHVADVVWTPDGNSLIYAASYNGDRLPELVTIPVPPQSAATPSQN